ncbi:hypothetical protein [Aquariibacter albus]|uniref:Phosphatidylinositol kinase n=1 Tax=Aquariibacter albus TaxID=2759899 RepID=A0A839HPH0_9BURK|nr:hypothetical protein [Aquariibacter albus]MBB1161488.1 hypothetical protein [Aquariibacter albus]
MTENTRLVPGLDLDDTSRPPWARLMSGGLTVEAGQENKVWRGQLQVPGSTESCVPAVVKWMNNQPKVAIELACALAAAELKLDVPRGVVVLAERDQLPGLPVRAKPLPNTQDFLCFGSVHQWPDDSAVRMLDDAAAEEHTWRRLCEMPAAAPGAAWDELVANADRHTGNLIFDGHRYWFIDHELALQPLAQVIRRWAVQANRQRVLEHRARGNELAAQLARRRPSDHGLQGQPAKFQKAGQRLGLLADRMRQWHTGYPPVDDIWPMAEVVLRGIAARLEPLALMVNERLGVREGASLWNSSPPNN